MDSTSLTRAPAAGEPGTNGARTPEVDRLLTDLIAATTTVAQLRVELGDALREVDRWRTVAEQRQARLEHWNGRERRGVTTAEPEPDLSKPAPPASKHRARVVAVVAGAILALAGLAVVLAIWPSTGLALAEGLGIGAVGAGLIWAAGIAGERSGHRRYTREQAGASPALSSRTVRGAPRPTARGAVTTANIRALSPAGNGGGALEPVGRRADNAHPQGIV
jgi:hypothetical protein